jgi:hypothetical protein
MAVAADSSHSVGDPLLPPVVLRRGDRPTRDRAVGEGCPRRWVRRTAHARRADPQDWSRSLSSRSRWYPRLSDGKYRGTSGRVCRLMGHLSGDPQYRRCARTLVAVLLDGGLDWLASTLTRSPRPPRRLDTARADRCRHRHRVGGGGWTRREGKLLLEVAAEITNRRVLVGPTRNRLVAGPACEELLKSSKARQLRWVQRS